MNGCTAPLTCLAALPGGYCTADCSSAACGDGQTCGEINGAGLCLKPCQQSGDCRDGYQCFGQVCVPKCAQDADCGVGFQCAAGGLCMPYDGVPVGGACGGDPDCSTRYCLLGTCEVSCDRDAACASGQTCALNVIGNTGLTPTTRIQPACTARRATAAPGATCATDADCDRGACQLGLCVELCANTGDCHGTGVTCTNMSVLLDIGLE
jgi:hypothetical protein